MKRFGTLIAAVCLVATSAFGGTVTFNPEKTNYDITVSPVPGMTSIDLTYAAADLQAVDSVNVALASDLPIDGFDVDASFNCVFCQNATRDESPRNGWFVGGFTPGNFGGLPVSAPLGTLNVVIPDTVQAGDVYFIDVVSVGVDSALGNEGVPEALTGQAIINITPEPATLGLLCLGAVGFIRRRH